MSRYLGMAGAGALLVAVAGCTLDSFLTPSSGLAGSRQVVAGSVDQVAEQIQQGLSDAGISVLSKRVGSDLRLAGMTKSQKVFCLHLYGQTVRGEEKTLVRLQWDRGADETFWPMVLQLLAAPDSNDAERREGR